MNASRPTNTTVAVLAAVVFFAILGIVGTNETLDRAPTFGYDPADHPAGAAVVTAVRATGDLSVFGIRFRDPSHHLVVAFTVPERCTGRINELGDWPPADPGCRGPAGIAGVAAGGGRTATGDLIVAVEIETSAACASLAQPGMPWPIDEAACRRSP